MSGLNFDIIAGLMTVFSLVTGFRGIAQYTDNTENGFRGCLRLGIYAILLQIWAIAIWVYPLTHK